MPEFPESLKYLYDWWKELRMGEEADMGGLRLTWTALDAWARHMDVQPEPREIEGLFWLDASARNPGTE